MAETPGKKRKRPDERQDGATDESGGRSPPKSIPTIRISSTLQPRYSPPIIATSPGVCLPEHLVFHSYSKRAPTTPKKRKEGEARPAQELLLRSSSHKTIDYMAREDGPQSMSSLLKHYLCVFSPEDGELQVVEARKMVVRGGVRSLEASDEASDPKARMQRRNELGEAFGTKKAKRAIAALSENAISPGVSRAGGKLDASDANVLSVIGEATVGMPTREDLQAAIDESRPIPKGNFAADDIRDVYDPAEIIGPDILNAIPVRDWQEKHRRDESVKVSSRFVGNRITREAARPDAVQRLRVLRYLLFLIVFWQLSRRGRTAAAARTIARRDRLRELLQPAPEPVIESIRRRFSEQGEMRKRQVDLLMTHCAALACVVDGFDTDIFDLREDLKLEDAEMAQYFAEIGAPTKLRRIDGNSHRFARLTLPLQFPKAKMPRARRY